MHFFHKEEEVGAWSMRKEGGEGRGGTDVKGISTSRYFFFPRFLTRSASV